MAQSNLTDQDKARIAELLSRSTGVTAWEAYCTIGGTNRIGITSDDLKRYMDTHAIPMTRDNIVLKRRKGLSKQTVYTNQHRLPTT